jgi:hypothetical protein
MIEEHQQSDHLPTIRPKIKSSGDRGLPLKEYHRRQ